MSTVITLPNVNPLDSMVAVKIRGKVVYMEATFKALEEIKKDTGIDFMDPNQTEERAQEIWKELQSVDTLMVILSHQIRHVGDDDIRPTQQEWTPERLKQVLSIRNIWGFISSVYDTLGRGRDSGAEPAADEAVGPTDSPLPPDDAPSLPTTGQ